MASEKHTKTRRVGQPTDETTPVAAIIQISSEFQSQSYYFQEDTASQIIPPRHASRHTRHDTPSMR